MCPSLAYMNMYIRRTLSSFLMAAFTAITLAALPVLCDTAEVYGPVNLLKTMHTPFGASDGQQRNDSSSALEPLSLQARSGNSLSTRLIPQRLYLPGRLVIGSTAEFIIRGKPGSWAALAMADKNTGAKPIYGHMLHLGPDRKVVSLGQIPETGVLSLTIDTPIEGDLIGLPLYFEAAIWSRPDFTDMELATPVPSESTAAQAQKYDNAVIMAAEPVKKRGVRIVPTTAVQMQQQLQGSNSMGSGRP
jgi:hypothetical protein